MNIERRDSGKPISLLIPNKREFKVNCFKNVPNTISNSTL